MGLFSLFSKNKQETAAQDSGYFSREEDPAAVRARSKRASSAGEGAPRPSRKTRAVDDPVLPEKKRARRRLVGAAALALAVAVGLPMLLDSEPKPIASDIAIQIPSRDKAAPLPLPASPGEARPTAPAPVPADTLDKREQFVDPNEIKTVKLPEKKEAVPDAAPVLKKPEPDNKAELAKAEAEAKAKAKVKAEAEAKARKAEKLAEQKAAEQKAAELKAAKQEKTPDDNARALAILEGKAADKAKAPEAGSQKFVVQVAALGSQEKVDELQEKLSAAGIRAHTHKVSTPSGERIQVRVGPFSREEADKMRARLDKVGLSGSMVRPDGK
jgi:DedD protein